MFIDAAGLNARETYRLLVGSVVPRPIAWVTSGRPPKPVNLAPFSSFTWVSQFPALLGFTVNGRDPERKDTIRNIEDDHEYVVNIATESMLAQLHASSEALDPTESEAVRIGAAVTASHIVSVPRLRDTPISMECRFERSIRFRESGGDFVVGEVLAWHIHDSVLVNGRIDTELLRPLGRLAGPRYTTLGEVTELPPVPGG